MHPIKRTLIAVAASLFTAAALAEAAPRQPSASAAGGVWHSKLEQILPLLGHRNWIMVVDSAYPLQSSPGVETLETNADQVEVVREVLRLIGGSIHVRPIVYMDAELPYLSERDAPGVSAYRKNIAAALQGLPVQSLLHEKIIEKVDETGRTFHIVILKTTMTIPYTSVFLQLDCKYWSAQQEQQLRKTMSGHQAK